MTKVKYTGQHYCEVDGPHVKTVDKDDAIIYVGCAFVLGFLVGLIACGFR